MKITITNVAGENILLILNEVGNSSKINGMLAYKLAKIASSVRAELVAYFEAKQKIVENHTDGQDDKGKLIWRDRKQADEEWDEIKGEEVEISFKPLSEDDFERLDCTMSQAEILMQLVEEQNEQEK